MKTLPRSVVRALMLACILVGLFAIYIGLILLNDEFYSNVVFEKTALEPLSRSAYLAVELLAFFTAYAFLLFALFTDGALGGLWALLACFGATTLRHAVLLWLSFGELWAELSNLTLELLQLGLVFLACYLSIRSFDRAYAVMQSGATYLERSCPDRSALVYPAARQSLKADPIKRGAFFSSAALVAFRVLGRLVYDFQYGAPTDAVDAMWMVLYYSADVLIGVGGYFLMLWIVRQLSKRRC